MKVILGLGNPGREYENTRHNVGWWVLDHLADVWRFEGWRQDGESLAVTGVLGGEKVRLLKPLTYMNLSGAVLRPYVRRPFWAAATDLMVVVDEVALPIGTSRLRARGSAGGHNGLKSVQQALGTMDYPRLRIGIRPADEQQQVGDLADFVLSPADAAEREAILALFPGIRSSLETWVHDGIERAMNDHNRLSPPIPPQ